MMTPMEEQPNDNGGGGANRDSRPDPDPTRLTQALLRREIASLREILEKTVEGQNGIVNARFDGMDKAIKLLQTIADRMPEEVKDKLNGLKELHEEKFDSIQTQFKERDTRTEETSRDSKVAIAAALQAAKEAVGEQNKSSALAIAKSEAATTKQIDGLIALITTSNEGIKDSVGDAKARLDRIEGQNLGQATAKTTQQTSTAGIVAIIGLVAAIAFGLGGVLAALLK